MEIVHDWIIMDASALMGFGQVLIRLQSSVNVNLNMIKLIEIHIW